MGRLTEAPDDAEEVCSAQLNRGDTCAAAVLSSARKEPLAKIQLPYCCNGAVQVDARHCIAISKELIGDQASKCGAPSYE